MGRKTSISLALLITLPTATLAQTAAPPTDAAAIAAAAAAAQTPSQQIYQLLLKSAPEGVDEDCKAIFAQLGAPPDIAQQIVDHVRTAGPAVVIEGAQAACEQIIAAFDKVGMEAEMRPKPAASGGAAAQAGAQAGASQAGGAAPKGASTSLFEGHEHRSARRGSLQLAAAEWSADTRHVLRTVVRPLPQGHPRAPKGSREARWLGGRRRGRLRGLS